MDLKTLIRDDITLKFVPSLYKKTGSVEELVKSNPECVLQIIQSISKDSLKTAVQIAGRDSIEYIMLKDVKENSFEHGFIVRVVSAYLSSAIANSVVDFKVNSWNTVIKPLFSSLYEGGRYMFMDPESSIRMIAKYFPSLSEKISCSINHVFDGMDEDQRAQLLFVIDQLKVYYPSLVEQIRKIKN